MTAQYHCMACVFTASSGPPFQRKTTRAYPIDHKEASKAITKHVLEFIIYPGTCIYITMALFQR